MKIAPGQSPKPDNQGKSSTCTRNALSKALTGGLDEGIFGTKLDVSQDYITSALVNKDKDVGGRFPTDFNQGTLLVMDNTSMEYYKITMMIVLCTYADLLQNWCKSKFVVVYKTHEGPHCVYVNKIANGKLCCINSHGKKDQFPQLKPENVIAIYKVAAFATKADINAQTKKTGQSNLKKQVNAQSEEIARLSEELNKMKKKDEEREKLEKEREKLEKEKMEKGRFWTNLLKKGVEKVKTVVGKKK